MVFEEVIKYCDKCCKFPKDMPSVDLDSPVSELFYDNADIAVKAMNALQKIINSYGEKNINRITAEQALDACQICDYKSPRIKNHLESQGIKIS